jgi:hypothetical protein
MKTFVTLIARTRLIGFIFVAVLSPATLPAMTQILPDANVEGNPHHIMELIGTFDRAQEAIRAQDLEALMALYAPNYHYRGLTKADIREIWAEVFANYDLIANIHIFSAFKIAGSDSRPIAEITCSGSLWARSLNTKERISIDSWHQEVHHLIREEDGWRIVGHLGEAPILRRFGAAPHPLF